MSHRLCACRRRFSLGDMHIEDDSRFYTSFGECGRRFVLCGNVDPRCVRCLFYELWYMLQTFVCFVPREMADPGCFELLHKLWSVLQALFRVGRCRSCRFQGLILALVRAADMLLCENTDSLMCGPVFRTHTQTKNV